MRRLNRKKKGEVSQHNVWRSYSDMMSGLLLLFVLIMAVCLMQAQKSYTEKLAEQAKQLQTQNALEQSQSQVDEQAAQLSQQEDQLASQEMTLAEQQAQLMALQESLDAQAAELSQKESDLAASQSQIDEQNTLLAQRDEDLAQRDEELAASQALLDEQTSLMAEQQQKIDQIIGVKADLIASLNEEFQANQITVDIDSETGAIVLDSSVLFEFNESELTEEGLRILAQILPIYCQTLLSDEYEEYVAEIIIDGYTDTEGDYVTNMKLSQDRAYAVAEYLIGSRNSFLDEEAGNTLLQKLTANGKSMGNPILKEDGTVDMDASRRVEIKFRLKDEEMIAQLQEVLEENGIADSYEPSGEAEQEETEGGKASDQDNAQA